MSAEIKALPGIDPARPLNAQVSDEVVRMLKDLLAQAMRGDLRAVLLAGVRPDGITTYAFAGAMGTGHEMVAAVADAQFALLAQRMDGQRVHEGPLPDDVA